MGQYWASQVVLVVKNLPAYAGDIRDLEMLEAQGSIPGSGRSPGKGNGNLLQCSHVENHMNRGAWWAVAHRVIKSWTQMKLLSTHTHTDQRLKAQW